MRNHTDVNITPATLASYADTPDPRLNFVMQTLIRTLHGFVREVKLTQDEWFKVMEFLADAGRICAGNRNEFILLSDLLGVSMLVDGLNNNFPERATPTTVLGPFHSAHAPDLPFGAPIGRPEDGAPCLMKGRVVDLDGTPVAGALLDVWETDENGNYDLTDPSQPDVNLRGKFRSQSDGSYRIVGVKPKGYPIPSDGPGGRLLHACARKEVRPAHVHFLITAEGYRTLGTHLFVADDPNLETDPVFATKDRLIQPFDWIADPMVMAAEGLPVPFWRCVYDFVLTPA
jgi:hydroxyquinol 1,2-dioxygenase